MVFETSIYETRDWRNDWHTQVHVIHISIETLDPHYDVLFDRYYYQFLKVYL